MYVLGTVDVVLASGFGFHSFVVEYNTEQDDRLKNTAECLAGENGPSDKKETGRGVT